MLSNDKNYYQICRKLAGFTQESVLELLGVEIRSLSDYETGKRRVPDDIVCKMAEIYNAPLLAIWHLKTTSELGKRYLPDIFPTQTDNDIGLQTIMANRDAKKAEDSVLLALEDGKLCIDDLVHIDSFIEYSKASIGKRMSAKMKMIEVRNNLIREKSEESA